MKIDLIDYPSDYDWMEVKRRALVTVGKSPINSPSSEWKHSILKARHSPIRYLIYSYYMEIPYWVSTHLARHVHAQPYIKSQRNDRQSDYDRDAARQDATISMIFDVNLAVCLCQCVSIAVEYVMKCMGDVKNNDR